MRHLFKKKKKNLHFLWGKWQFGSCNSSCAIFPFNFAHCATNDQYSKWHSVLVGRHQAPRPPSAAEQFGIFFSKYIFKAKLRQDGRLAPPNLS